MKAKTFARVKEAIAAAQPAANEAVASATVRDLALARDETAGQSGEDAARRAAMVSLGKKSILFRFGNAQNERSGLIEELGAIMANDARYPSHLQAVIAGTALHELTFDKCGTCFGRGEVQDHSIQGREGRQPMKQCDSCGGMKRVRFKEDERIQLLARLIAADAKIDHEDDTAYHEFVTFTAKELRSSRRLREILSAVGFGKQKLLEAEREATEGAAFALERAKPE